MSLFHSDRGRQYTSARFADYCARNNVLRSLGCTGICYDNAVAESFFATYKKELIHTRPWPTLNYLRRKTFSWIEEYYNRTRRHSTLGYLTPEEYKQGHPTHIRTRGLKHCPQKREHSSAFALPDLKQRTESSILCVTEETVVTMAESMYPRELIFEVGCVVMSAAGVEDKAGELVQLVKSVLQGKTDVPAKGWAASGAQLVEAFRKVADTDLSDRLSAALELRNHVVHGVVLDAGIAEIPGINWLSLKRNLGSRTPVGFSLKG